MLGGVAGACEAKRNQPATDGGDVHLTDPWVGFEHGRRGSNFGSGGDLKLEGGRGGFGNEGGEVGRGNWSWKGGIGAGVKPAHPPMGVQLEIVFFRNWGVSTP